MTKSKSKPKLCPKAKLTAAGRSEKARLARAVEARKCDYCGKGIRKFETYVALRVSEKRLHFRTCSRRYLVKL